MAVDPAVGLSLSLSPCSNAPGGFRLLLPHRLLPLSLPSHLPSSVAEIPQSTDFIEYDKWQFIKRWEQMGTGLWRKINDEHIPLNGARFGSKHRPRCSL